MIRISLIAICFSVFSCTPVVRTSIYKKRPPSTGNIMIFEYKDRIPPNAVKIGLVDVFEHGFSVNCAYEQVIEITKNEALRIGGNAIHIVKHFLPDANSTCHRLESYVLHIENVELYEPRFSWNANRKLEWKDFKSATKPDMDENEAAAISCGIGYNSNVISQMGLLEVNVYNFIDCNKSWVDSLTKNDALLAHEQTHFDLCELYTRKLRYAVSLEKFRIFNGITFYSNDLTRLKTLCKTYNEELQNMQTVYDDETVHGTLAEKQLTWTLQINQQLEELSEFEKR